MRGSLKFIGVAFLFVTLSMTFALAQQKDEKPVPGAEQIGVYDLNYKYIEGRDPFENLTQTPKTVTGKRIIRGVQDLLVEEVQIVGVYKMGKKFHVMIRGAGLDRAHTVTVGQKFYNGEILDIVQKPDKHGRTQQCVIFKQQTDDPIRPFIRVEKCVTGT